MEIHIVIDDAVVRRTLRRGRAVALAAILCLGSALAFAGPVTHSFTSGGVISSSEVNQNFLDVLGYELQDIVGEHHRMFCRAEESERPEYAQFWRRLRRGEPDEGEYRRVGSDGRDIWIRASYNPVMGPDGKPAKIVKYAMDITEARVREADASARLRALDKV